MAWPRLLTCVLRCLLCISLGPLARSTEQGASCLDARHGVPWQSCNELTCTGTSCKASPRRQLLQMGAEMSTQQTLTSAMKAATNVSDHQSFTSVTNDSGGGTDKVKEKLEGWIAQERSNDTSRLWPHVAQEPPDDSKDLVGSREPHARLLSKKVTRRKGEEEVLVVVAIVVVGILVVLLIAFAGSRPREDNYDSSSDGEMIHSKRRFNTSVSAKYRRAEPSQRMNRPPMAMNVNASPEHAPLRPVARDFSIGSASAKFTPEPVARSPYRATKMVQEQLLSPQSYLSNDGGAEVQSEGTGALMSTRNHLCPGLVVPPGKDCVLALPTFRTLNVFSRNSVVFSVRDLNGSSMIQGEIFAEQWSPNGVGGQPVARLCMTTPSGESGPELASVKASVKTGGARSAYIYDGQGYIFAHFARDPFRNSYVLTSLHIDQQVHFVGDFTAQHGTITSDINEPMAEVDPCHLYFDPAGEHFRIRIYSEVDACLILCGLLAIQHIEAA
mmetsp:Transcript_140039/g.254823  ORF Transcript_140039/g.254823 Transcript_140039/m.254823 type:complete len:499 (+) Transcript_140039:15-1511(+)